MFVAVDEENKQVFGPFSTDATLEDAAIFAYSVLKRLEMFNDKQEMLMHLLDPQGEV